MRILSAPFSRSIVFDMAKHEPCVRLLFESLRLAREHASTVTLDEGFAADVEAGIASHREPLAPPAWD